MSLISRLRTRPEKSGPRSRGRLRPRFDGLEDRLAPAVVGNLFVQGTTLIFAGNAANNAITVSGAGGSLTIADSAGTIRSTVPGFAGGMSTVSGTIPSNVTNIAINGNNGLDTITIPAVGLSLSRGISLSAKQIFLNGNLTTNAGAIGGAITVNGPVALGGTAAQTISSHAATSGPITINGPILGTAGGNTLLIDAGNNVTSKDVSITSPIILTGAADSLEVDGNNLTLGTTTLNGGGTGSLTLKAQNKVALAGTMSVGSGQIAISANQDGIGGEGFTTSANILANSGKVSIQTYGAGNITVQDIIASGATAAAQVTLTAGGAILDGNGNGQNVLANTLSVSAAAAISLDTTISVLSDAVTSAAGGAISIRNGATALDVLQASTVDAPITITNNGTILAGDGGPVRVGGAGRTLTLTSTGATSDITLQNVQATAGSLVVSSGRDILPAGAPPIITAPTMNLTAVRNIGTAGAAGTGLPINTSTLGAASTSPTAGLINIANNKPLVPIAVLPLTVTGATVAASTGTGNNVTVTTPDDFTISGIVSTATGDILLQNGLGNNPDGGNLAINSGQVSAPGGNVNLDPTGPTILAAGASIAAGAGSVNITTQSTSLGVIITLNGAVSATTDINVMGDSVTSQTATIGVAGTLAAGGNILLEGFFNDTYNITGKLAAGNNITVLAGEQNGALGASTLIIGGTLTTGTGNVLIDTRANTLIVTSGTIASGGTTTIGNATQSGPVTMTLGGTINSTGVVTINGAADPSVSVIDIAGATTSAAGVTIQAIDTAGGGSLLLSTRGPIAGSSVTIAGANKAGSTDGNTLSISGPVTATTGGIAITGGPGVDSIAVAGILSAATGATLNGNGGGDTFVVTPSTLSAFAFSGGGSLQIGTAIANILFAPPDFASSVPPNTIRFKPASGFKDWTNVGGTWTVAPSVP